MGCLILGGESIYLFAYDLRRDYTKPLLEALQVTNTELGQLSSMFGILALLCYFPGGWVADRFSARKLLAFSLLSTGALGLGLQTFPVYPVLLGLYGLMGITSILTFWGALVKATRQWGGRDDQGKAFGILDGGRGLVSALVASAALWTFGGFDASVDGLRGVLALYIACCWTAALLVWFGVPEDDANDDNDGDGETPPVGAAAATTSATTFGAVIRMPVVWLQAVIILTAYAGYWGTFDVSGYAVDGFGKDDTDGAMVSTFAVWLRPPAAFAAGFLADRLRASRVVAGSFGLLIAAYVSFAVVPPAPDREWLLWVNAAVAGIGSFALRGVYFAILEEGNLPMRFTGTAVGIVSLIGFSPDVYVPPVSGYLIDNLGATGHRVFFAGLAVNSALGATAALLVPRFAQPRRVARPPAAAVHASTS
ncbi:MAG: MFS transporter [Myxococcota bacterium]